MSEMQFLCDAARYDRNRIAESKLPLCAKMRPIDALLAGAGGIMSDNHRERVMKRGGRPQTWGCDTASGGSG